MPSNVRPADFSPENMAACHAIAEAGGAAASSWADLRARLDLANNELSATQAQNARLKDIAVHLHWMARRYADGRQSYATSLHNENTRALLKMGVQLNATGDGTLWARDSGGRAYDDLTDEEAAQGREPDWKRDDKERRIEEQATLLLEAAAQFKSYERQHLAKSPPDQAKAATNREWADKLEAGARLGAMARK